MSRTLTVLVVVLLLVPVSVAGGVLAQEDTPIETDNETATETPEPTETPTSDEDTETESDSDTETSDEDSDSPISAPTNVSIDFGGFFSGLVDRFSGDEEPLEKGVIRYEEAEGEGYSTIYDWGASRLVDVEYEPETDSAVWVIYVPEDVDEDTVAITEGVEGSGEARQTRADLDQGPGLYFVRADIVHNDGIFGGEQCGSVATLKGSVNLRQECQETGMGSIFPEAPSFINLFIGSLAVAVGTVGVARKWGAYRDNKVTQL